MFRFLTGLAFGMLIMLTLNTQYFSERLFLAPAIVFMLALAVKLYEYRQATSVHHDGWWTPGSQDKP